MSVVRRPCLPCSSLARLTAVERPPDTKIAKKMNMSKILFLTLRHPCDLVFIMRQSCGVAHTVRLPHETQKFFVPDRCTAAARLM